MDRSGYGFQAGFFGGRVAPGEDREYSVESAQQK